MDLMELKELIERVSLKAAGRSVGLEVHVVDDQLVFTPLDPDDPRYSTDFILPSIKMVEACRADDFDFFYPFIDAGRLTIEQMHRAAARYHLGKTRSALPMFWMIDDQLDPLDAHISTDGWISSMLKSREPLLHHWRPMHCLFGLHLLSDGSLRSKSYKIDTKYPMQQESIIEGSLRSKSNNLPIAIVESEASAVVLSELFPEVLWMAYATVEHLDVELFAPLQGRTVTIYPCTDPSCSTYLFFLDLAEAIRGRYDLYITVATILEDHATPAQKERCIDLLEFLLEE